MNLRLLKSFLVVGQCGSVTKAADILHISQPALTRQIQDLEDMYGCKLFERSKKGLTMTASGYLLEVRAQEMLSLAERTKHEMLASGGFVGGIVRVGCVETSAAEWLASKLALLPEKYPQMQFEVYSADGDDIRALLDEDRLDLGLLLEPVETAKYDSFVLPVTERWGVVVRSDSEFAQQDEITRKALASIPLILPRRHIVLDSLQAWFGDMSDKIRVAGYHNIPTNGLLLVKQNLGALLCVEGSITIREHDDYKFVSIIPEKVSNQRMVRKRARKLSTAAENFWNLCQLDLA